MIDTPDAEIALLGCCMCSLSALGVAEDVGIVPESFESPSLGRIFAAIQRANAKTGANQLLDPIIVSTELGAELQVVGGRAYVHSLVGAVPATTNTRLYAEAVRQGQVHRETRAVLAGSLESDLHGTELLESVQEQIYRVHNPQQHGQSIADALKDLWQEAENPVKSVAEFPWWEVQYLTRGLRPGWLVYLAGEPRMGKTACALEIAHNEVKNGQSVLFASAEMTPAELAIRVAMRVGISSDALFGFKSMADKDWSEFAGAMSHTYWQNLVVEMVTKVADLPSLIRRHRPDLVIVDYLQLLGIPRGESRVEGTTRNSRNLKLLARRYNVPVLCLSQLSRADKGAKNRIPALQRLRDSGALEQDADAVVFVYRETEGGDDSAEVLKDEGHFIVAKARHGKEGRVGFTFHGETQQFVLTAKR